MLAHLEGLSHIFHHPAKEDLFMAISSSLLARQSTGKRANPTPDTTESIPSPHPTFVNSHGAAQILGMTANTLARWRMEKIGPKYFKLGGTRIRYRVDHLHEFLESQVIDPFSQATD